MQMKLNKKIKIIAEAGVNHNGDISIAKELIDVASEAGADIVKFQTFKAQNLVSDEAKMAEYQKKNTGKSESQLKMLQKLELKYEYHHELKEYANQKGIEFLSTAFDSSSLNFLVTEIGLKRLKIPSGEITNGPLILEHAWTKLPIILSTGMSDLSDIKQALQVICFGYMNEKNSFNKINKDEFKKYYSSKDGQEVLKKNVTILHCNTEYPTPLNDVNLAAMDTIHNEFKTDIGYSDHTLGLDTSLYAAAKGASIIEKHFTIDKKMKGPDQLASIEPEELKLLVKKIREIEQILGKREKVPSPSEIKNKEIARKSIMASKKIKKGSILKQEDLVIKRPGYGVSPMKFWDLIGTKAEKDYKKNEIFFK